MIDPGFEILNQRGTPMFFSDVFANRPTAGVVGRIFISTDTYAFYRDTGTTWDLIGGPGTGTITGSISAGQVAYGTAANTIGGSNNLFYNSSNARLGIGTASPQTNIQISDNKNGITSLQISNTTAGISSQSGVRLDSDASAGTMNIGKYSSTTSSYLSISSTDGYLSNASFGDITIQNEVATGRIKFSAGASSTSQMTLFSTGNLGIGVGLTDGGQRLQVTGNVNFGGASGFTWDNSNARLGIGTASPQTNIQINDNKNGITSLQIRNTTAGISSQSGVRLDSDASAGTMNIGKYSSTTSSYLSISSTDGYLSNASFGDITIQNEVATGRIKFSGGAASTSQMTLFSTGNLGIGVGLTDGGQRLQVGGTLNVTGASTFGGNITLSLNQNAQTSLTLSNTTSGGSAETKINFFVDSIGGNASIGKYSNGVGTYKILTGPDTYLYNGVKGDIAILNDFATGRIKFSGGGASTSQMTLFSTGNLGIGVGLTDSGQRLQVSGSALFTGSVTGTGNSSTYSVTASSALAVSKSITSTLIAAANNDVLVGLDVRPTFTNGAFTGVSNFALRVVGDTLLRGSGATDTTTALRIQNSGSTSLLLIRNDGVLELGGVDAGPLMYPITTSNAVSISGTNFGFYSLTSTQATDVGTFSFNGANLAQTSGNVRNVHIYRNFQPTSGTATYSVLSIFGTINQTGGANGITRGLYVNPTLTAAADWRSIEWSNNSGWGLYGSGTAANFLSGNLLLGSATSFTANEKLQVTGTQQNKHTITYSTGAVQSFRIQKDLTIGSGATISSASTLSNAVFTGDNIFGGNVTIPESSPFANVYGANYYQFNAAGITITQTQATGKRTLTQYYAQNYFKGSNSGTITDMSSIQIAGWYNNNTGSITPIITNAYQLLIADIGEYGHTFTLTNRWGIYQEGASDRNYMAGKLMLNTTTDTGQRLQLNGSIRIDGQTSGTAGGASGQHLIINCDGTTYKIALLNN